MRLGFVLTACGVSALLVSVATVEAATVKVTPSSQSYSTFQVDEFPPASGPPYQFAPGPGAPPVGEGSLQTNVPSSNSKLIIRSNAYNGTLLSDIDTFTYDVYLDPASTNNNPFYLNLYTDLDGNGTYDGSGERLDFAPPSASTGWQTFDVLNDPYFSGGQTWSDILTGADSNATIEDAFNSPGFPGIAFNIGDTASSYVGFDGALDNVVIGVDGQETVYDFDPQAAPVPEPASLALWGLMGVAIGGAAWRKRMRKN